MHCANVDGNFLTTASSCDVSVNLILPFPFGLFLCAVIVGIISRNFGVNREVRCFVPMLTGTFLVMPAAVMLP